jgi:hypothetical protein
MCNDFLVTPRRAPQDPHLLPPLPAESKTKHAQTFAHRCAPLGVLLLDRNPVNEARTSKLVSFISL